MLQETYHFLLSKLLIGHQCMLIMRTLASHKTANERLNATTLNIFFLSLILDEIEDVLQLCTNLLKITQLFKTII